MAAHPTEGAGERITWHRALPSRSVGTRLVRVELDGTPVLTGRLIGGEPIAVTPVCPHRARPMDGGAVYADVIACPHHQYTYDAYTGQNRFPRNAFPEHMRRHVKDIRTYPARDDGQWVWVGLPD